VEVEKGSSLGYTVSHEKIFFIEKLFCSQSEALISEKIKGKGGVQKLSKMV
jgi:hypothetical protein